MLPFALAAVGGGAAAGAEGDVAMGERDGAERDCEEDIVRFGKLECVRGRLLAVCETTGEY